MYLSGLKHRARYRRLREIDKIMPHGMHHHSIILLIIVIIKQCRLIIIIIIIIIRWIWWIVIWIWWTANVTKVTTTDNQCPGSRTNL